MDSYIFKITDFTDWCEQEQQRTGGNDVQTLRAMVNDDREPISAEEITQQVVRYIKQLSGPAVAVPSQGPPRRVGGYVQVDM